MIHGVADRRTFSKVERPPLFRHEDLFRLATGSLPWGVVVVDSRGTILLANQEFERQFGYRGEELLGRSLETLLPEAIHVTHPRRHAFQGRVDLRPVDAGRELSGRRRDGSLFPVEVRTSAVQAADDGDFTVVTVVDNAARRELETAAREAFEEQLEFERLVADLSFQFLNLPHDRMVEAIGDALERIGETLDVDRCSFFRFLDGDEPLAPIGSWRRPGIPPAPAITNFRERFPWASETVLGGQVLSFSRVGDIPNVIDRASYEALGILSVVTVPISMAGRVVGAVSFHMTSQERTWTSHTLHTARVIGAVFGHIVARSESDEKLGQAMSQIERVRDKLQVENTYLRREVQERIDAGVIIGQSQALRRVLEQARQVAATDSTVLLLGETGTGKELIATHIHEMSARHGRVMVRVNCSAIPSTLIESELFGREKGAFTGALARQIGRFELADHSTIFLDEIGDLPPDVQVKLLRVLEERQIERLGSPKAIHVDVRIIAATHRNLEQQIAKEAFREDLFYRLNVFPIHVPPLRERVEDIPLLVWRFVDEFSKAFDRRIDCIPREDMALLQRYAWPGNIRELRNVVERAMIVTTGNTLPIALPSTPSAPAAAAKRTLKLTDVEKEHIRSVLDGTGWRIRGAAGAAHLLGLKPTTLEGRMAKLGLIRPRPS
jgi:formate hydrogenlyase transcriptional activator